MDDGIFPSSSTHTGTHSGTHSAGAGRLNAGPSSVAPDFSVTVPHHGYHWWYVDAMSADRSFGLTIIAFIGSVFSPYYAWSRERAKRGQSAQNSAAGDPFQHCAINVSLYGRGGKRWCMTERTKASLCQSQTQFAVGPSALTWHPGTSAAPPKLVIDVDEVTVPFPTKLVGRVTLTPKALNPTQITLDGDDGHWWWPIAPLADVEVDFLTPSRRWQGEGYFDMNWGAVPLEQTFDKWHWSRATLPATETTGARAAILYDVTRRRTEPLNVAVTVDERGHLDPFTPPAMGKLTSSFWRIGRETRSEMPEQAKVVSTLEDAPFYARSMIQTQLEGHRVEAMHESLYLDRFASRWVQMLLPFKMPRVTKAIGPKA